MGFTRGLQQIGCPQQIGCLRGTLLAAAVLAAQFSTLAQPYPAPLAISHQTREILRTVAPVFIENHGQANPAVRFVSQAPGLSIGIRRSGMTLQLTDPTGRPHELRMDLLRSNPNPELIGENRGPSAVNLLLGNNPKQWVTRIPTYAGVFCREVYPGVDLRYHAAANGNIEYDFLLAPGVRPSIIRMRYSGAGSVEVNPLGELVVSIGGTQVLQRLPSVYQSIGGSKRQITALFRILSDGSIGFALGPLDETAPILIDPVLTFSSYLGGNGFDAAYAIAVDASGNIYVAGETASPNFPVPGGMQTAIRGAKTAFIAKINSNGSGLVYSTYLGGTQSDSARAIAVNSAGEVFVTGVTSSPDFPVTPGAFQAHVGALENVFVTKLNSTGGLAYSLLLGGDGSDFGTGVALDAAGNAYVTGYTSSTNFPITSGSFLTAYSGGFYDAFVTKINPTGTALAYSTYLGGAGNETAHAIAVDKAGNAYVTGQTDSSNFPVVNAFQPGKAGETDAFISKLNSAGSALVFSTYLGGGSFDFALSIALDASSNVYISGSTYSPDFPVTRGALQQAIGGNYDVFAAKLDTTGTQLVYATYLGGAGLDEGTAIAIDSNGNAWITGSTLSSDYPLQRALQPAIRGLRDTFLSVVSATGSYLIYSSYFGGTGDDRGSGIAIDNSGNAYLTGYAGSPDLTTTPGSLAPNYAGNYDAFVAKVFVDFTSFPRAKIGVFRSGAWTLDYAGTGRPGDNSRVNLGQPGDFPVVGDWNGDGRTKIGVFRNGLWLLADDSGTIPPGGSINFGQAGDLPVIGDWTGDGKIKIGVFRNGLWLLADNNGALLSRGPIAFGQAGDIPVVGDWTGDGKTKVGVFRNGIWFLADGNGGLSSRGIIGFGQAGDVPVMGDWNGDRKTKIGVFRNGFWFLGDDNGNLSSRSIIGFGQSGDIPIFADWNGDGRTKLGVVRSGIWFLDLNGDTVLSGDEIFSFGKPGDTPLSGHW